MARHDEHTLNTVLAACLRKRSPRWRASNLLSSEDLAALEGPGRPDILAEAPGATPVAVETEYEPARTVEKDARSRLQQRAAATGREIEHAIAVKLPAELRDVPVLGEALGFEPEAMEQVALLRQKWCAEPTVHGGKRR